VNLFINSDLSLFLLGVTGKQDSGMMDYFKKMGNETNSANINESNSPPVRQNKQGMTLPPKRPVSGMPTA
jgi:hypothetical protein